jgi:hypothetical protein
VPISIKWEIEKGSTSLHPNASCSPKQMKKDTGVWEKQERFICTKLSRKQRAQTGTPNGYYLLILRDILTPVLVLICHTKDYVPTEPEATIFKTQYTVTSL